MKRVTVFAGHGRGKTNLTLNATRIGAHRFTIDKITGADWDEWWELLATELAKFRSGLEMVLDREYLLDRQSNDTWLALAVRTVEHNLLAAAGLVALNRENRSAEIVIITTAEGFRRKLAGGRAIQAVALHLENCFLDLQIEFTSAFVLAEQRSLRRLLHGYGYSVGQYVPGFLLRSDVMGVSERRAAVYHCHRYANTVQKGRKNNGNHASNPKQDNAEHASPSKQ